MPNANPMRENKKQQKTVNDQDQTYGSVDGKTLTNRLPDEDFF